MAAITTTPTTKPVGIPLRAILAAAAPALALLWLVSFEGGVVSSALAGTGEFLHELFHDGRHLIGVPCH